MNHPPVSGYVICRMVLDDSPSIESDAAEYEACVEAVAGLVSICDVEETYESLMENYIEWENAINHQALRQLVSFEVGHIEVQDSRKLVARKLANLLASARLYLDSLPKHAKHILSGDSGSLETMKRAPSHQYDTRLSYRVMEALRNYSQHAALPVHRITTAASREDTADAFELTFAVLPHIDREQLAQDGNFKKTVLDEIANLEKMALKPMVREYLEGVSQVHNTFRRITEQRRNRWLAQLKGTTQRFADQFQQESTFALAVLPIDADGMKAAEEVYINSPVPAYLAHMQKNYVVMVNFAKRKVTF